MPISGFLDPSTEHTRSHLLLVVSDTAGHAAELLDVTDAPRRCATVVLRKERKLMSTDPEEYFDGDAAWLADW